jgi:hypothetical protein
MPSQLAVKVVQRASTAETGLEGRNLPESQRPGYPLVFTLAPAVCFPASRSFEN